MHLRTGEGRAIAPFFFLRGIECKCIRLIYFTGLKKSTRPSQKKVEFRVEERNGDKKKRWAVTDIDHSGAISHTKEVYDTEQEAIDQAKLLNEIWKSVREENEQLFIVRFETALTVMKWNKAKDDAKDLPKDDGRPSDVN